MDERFTYQRARLPVLLRAYNRVIRSATRLGLGPRALSADYILGRTQSHTDLTDFGEGDVVEPLETLVDALESEADLSPFGRQSLQIMLVETLSRRLRIVDHIARHPAIRREVIERPIFVLGFPRTGTTLLFNLLAQDPVARPLVGWEAAEPLAPRRTRPGRRDARIKNYRRRLRGLNYVVPELRKVHEMTCEGPEECNMLLMRTLVTWYYVLISRVPRYERWLAAQPRLTHETAYRLHKDQLKLLQHQRRGGRWLLKGPAHLNALDAIAEVYPDACIVQTHRDPAKVHPSTCSLIALVRSILSDRIDPVTIGREALEQVQRTLTRLLKIRETFPAARIIDVRYADLIADPLATIGRIHDHFDLPLPDEMARRTQDWLETNPRHKHGVHRYALEAFGTDREEIDRLGAAYRERFDIPLER
jgi:Sulfotransferase family